MNVTVYLLFSLILINSVAPQATANYQYSERQQNNQPPRRAQRPRERCVRGSVSTPGDSHCTSTVPHYLRETENGSRTSGLGQHLRRGWQGRQILELVKLLTTISMVWREEPIVYLKLKIGAFLFSIDNMLTFTSCVPLRSKLQQDCQTPVRRCPYFSRPSQPRAGFDLFPLAQRRGGIPTSYHRTFSFPSNTHGTNRCHLVTRQRPKHKFFNTGFRAIITQPPRIETAQKKN